MTNHKLSDKVYSFHPEEIKDINHVEDTLKEFEADKSETWAERQKEAQAGSFKISKYTEKKFHYASKIYNEASEESIKLVKASLETKTKHLNSLFALIGVIGVLCALDFPVQQARIVGAFFVVFAGVLAFQNIPKNTDRNHVLEIALIKYGKNNR
jgi:hypothetical protein